MKYIKSYTNEYYYLDSQFSYTDFPKGRFHTISNIDINAISKGLNIKFKQTASIPYGSDNSYIYFYYNLDTREIVDGRVCGNWISISVFSYDDEWFRVSLATSKYSSQLQYWCDQVEGVIRCISDFLNNKPPDFRQYDNKVEDFIKEEYNEKLFTELSEEEWKKYSVDFLISKTDEVIGALIDFTPRELNMIKELEIDSKFSISGPFGFSLRMYPRCKGLCAINAMFSNGKFIYSIYKCADEWYYMSDIYARYYKCDSFDGVIQCIDYIKNSIKR